MGNKSAKPKEKKTAAKAEGGDRVTSGVKMRQKGGKHRQAEGGGRKTRPESAPVGTETGEDVDFSQFTMLKNSSRDSTLIGGKPPAVSQLPDLLRRVFI